MKSDKDRLKRIAMIKLKAQGYSVFATGFKGQRKPEFINRI